MLGLRQANSQDDGWYDIVSDEGKPVPNLRLPVELYSEVDELPGLIRVGAGPPDVTIIEFFDYNCPFCRKAARELGALLAADRGVRLGLVNNPILSPQSKEAALIELAVLKLGGPDRAYELHRRLYRLPGRVEGGRSLTAATELGFDRVEIMRTAAAADVASALDRQLGLAASLGFSATPSFLIAGAGILGYPGPKSLAAIVASVRRCEAIACAK
jgi:protein-disulfide isomerase